MSPAGCARTAPRTATATTCSPPNSPAASSTSGCRTSAACSANRSPPPTCCSTPTCAAGEQTADQRLYRRGDLVVVRSDGLRVVLDIVRLLNDQFDRKLGTWTQLLAQHPPEDLGLVFVVVDARTRTPKAPTEKMLDRIASVRNESAVGAFERVNGRLLYARLGDWFTPTGITDAGKRMVAHNPIAGGVADDVSLVDPSETPAYVEGEHWQHPMREAARLHAALTPAKTLRPAGEAAA